MSFADPVVASNFSFLRGASQPQALVLTALLLGHTGMGIADRNTVAGVVRAWAALREIRGTGKRPPVRIQEGDSPGETYFVPAPEDPERPDPADLARRAEGFKLMTGARLVFADGTPDVVVYPANREGWGRLTRLLTLGNRRAVKGECTLYLDDLVADVSDLLLIVIPGLTRDLPASVPQIRPGRAEAGESRLRAGMTALEKTLVRLRGVAPGSVWLAATMPRRGDDRRRLARLRAVAQAARVPLIATNDVLYADPADRDLQDVLTCVREGVTVTQAGRRLEVNAERHLKPPREMARLFADAPEAIAETQRLRACVEFDLGQLAYEYPDEPVPPGWEPQSWLEDLTWRSAREFYMDGIPPKVTATITSELALIAELEYARYFLTIHDIVREARAREILCQGRGSAANSAVCFVLGITSVDPAEHDVLFARFISAERKEPPDIDVDFEHERREEVIQYIYEKYGRHRAGIVATVIHYRPRSAIRDVGKALGLSEDVTARLASTQWGSWGRDIPEGHVRQTGIDPDNPVIARALGFAGRLIGFPRHLSQHVGGFVLARGRLDDIVPIGNAAMEDRTFIEWDKDDIDALGLMKVDVLALGMLTCIAKALKLMDAFGLAPSALRAPPPEGEEGAFSPPGRGGGEADGGGRGLRLTDIPSDDPATYDMLCRGDSLGVFQVESRAQMNMLPRMKPRVFYDLVIEVAIVRPGPIQGDMVHPYLRRRSGLEPVEYPSPAPPHPPDELKNVLRKTLGVPLFQEQAMKLAMVAAEFSDIEANQLRRAMATFRHVGGMEHFEALMVERMAARGYDRAFAQRCFDQIKGFGSYGFPESHAASFAKLVYISSWIKCHQPAVFACALLNSQPMGFYAPAQIVRGAAEHGVEIRGVDVNHSGWDNSLERRADGTLALRLGFRQIDGFRQADAERLVAWRTDGYAGLDEMAARADLHGRPLRQLADADAFRSIGLDRRAALWAVRRLPDDDPLPLFAAARARELGADPAANLPAMPVGEHIAADYQTARLSLKGHPMGVVRPVFTAEGLLTAARMNARPDGARVGVAGVVLVRQRPGNGKAIFLTLEDETGIVNVILWARTFERNRATIMAARLLEARGIVQKSVEGVIHLMVDRVFDRSAELARLSDTGHPTVARARADEFGRPHAPRGSHPRDVRVLPASRDFH